MVSWDLYSYFFEWNTNIKTEIRHKRRITVAAASKILANLTYAYKGYGLSMGTMLAGVSTIPFRFCFFGSN